VESDLSNIVILFNDVKAIATDMITIKQLNIFTYKGVIIFLYSSFIPILPLYDN